MGYFDAATAAPLHPAAREALLAALADGWADPGKLYAQARRANHLAEAARAATAEVIGVRAEELTFTPGGADACHQAVAATLRGRRRAGARFIHSSVEHSAIFAAAQRHLAEGGAADAVRVDQLGRVDLDAFTEAVAGPEVAAAALMSANHEVGTVQPVARVAAACAEAGVPLIVDAAQSLGRMPVPTGWSILTGSARKWGGPAGVGVLAVRAGVRFEPDPLAAPSPGTSSLPAGVSLPLVVAAAASLRSAAAEAAAQDARLRPLVDRIRATVAARVPDVEVVGDPIDRLPHIVTFSCLYLDGETLLHALDQRGFAVSSGSSCTAQTLRPSHVLEAMGVLSQGNVRISLHRETTEAEVDRFLAELPGIVAGLRSQAGVTGL